MTIKQIACGDNSSYILTNDGDLFSCGDNTFGQLGVIELSQSSLFVWVMSGVSYISAGLDHVMVIKSDNSLWGFGRNGSGQLGDGTCTNKTIPVKIANNVIHVSCGGYHTLFIRSDFSLWAAGRNIEGQLGDNERGSSVPVRVLYEATYASAGNYHSLVIKPDSSLWAFGANSYGQLGNNSNLDTNTLIMIATHVKFANAGIHNSAFFDFNGRIFVTGRNLDSIPINHQCANTNYPIEIHENTQTNSTIIDTYTAMMKNNKPSNYNSMGSLFSAWNQHSLFVDINGNVFASGYNAYGQLGNGTTDDSNEYMSSRNTWTPRHFDSHGLIFNSARAPVDLRQYRDNDQRNNNKNCETLNVACNKKERKFKYRDTYDIQDVNFEDISCDSEIEKLKLFL